MNVGEPVKVKVIGFDERGKVKLSMRVVDQATGEDITEKVGVQVLAAGTGNAAIAIGATAIGASGGSGQEYVAPVEGSEQPAVGE